MRLEALATMLLQQPVTAFTPASSPRSASPVSLRARLAAVHPTPPIMSAGAVEGTSILDDSLGVGYEGTGEDWSHAKSSERKDRPLTNEQLKLLTAKSNAAGAPARLGQASPTMRRRVSPGIASPH
jgi:hypothetical protein